MVSRPPPHIHMFHEIRSCNVASVKLHWLASVGKIIGIPNKKARRGLRGCSPRGEGMNEIVDSLDPNPTENRTFCVTAIYHMYCEFCFPMKNSRPQKLEGASREEAKTILMRLGHALMTPRTVARVAVQTAASRAAEG